MAVFEFDGALASARQFLKGLHEFGGRLQSSGFQALAHQRQHTGVDPVGLGERADGLGEPSRTQRIDDGDLEPAGVEVAMRLAVELARGLHHHDDDIVAGEDFLQSLQTPGVVGQYEAFADGVDMDVEPGFTDVDADVDWRRGASLRRYLTLHAGLAPHHLFRPSVKGRTDPAHPRFKPRGIRSRPPDRRGAATPRRSARFKSHSS